MPLVWAAGLRRCMASMARCESDAVDSAPSHSLGDLLWDEDQFEKGWWEELQTSRRCRAHREPLSTGEPFSHTLV